MKDKVEGNAGWADRLVVVNVEHQIVSYLSKGGAHLSRTINYEQKRHSKIHRKNVRILAG